MSSPAPCDYSDPITQTWSLASRLCLSLLWRTDCPVVCKADNSASSVHSLIIFLGFITLGVWPRAQTEHPAPLLLCVLGLVCLSRRFGQARSSLARSLCTLRKKLQNGTQEEIRNMRSPRCLCCWKSFRDHIHFLALHWLQANTQWRHAERNEEWVLCFGGRG